MNKNVFIISLELVPKIWDFQIYKCHNITFFGLKSEREYNIGRIKEVEKMRKIKEVEKIEKVRIVEKIIKEIK